MIFPRFRILKSAGLVLILAVGLIAGSGCKKKAADQATEKAEKKLSDMLSRATAGKAEVDLKSGQIKVKTPEGDAYITSGGGTWPGDLPEDLPPFKGGAIQGSTNSDSPAGKTWMVIFKFAEADAVSAYIEDLKNDGWNVMMTSDVPKGTFTQIEKENFLIQLTYSTEEKILAMSIVRQKQN